MTIKQPHDGAFIDWRIVLPEHVHFSDLSLEIGDDGDVKMNTLPLRQICEASGLDPEALFREGAEMDLANLVHGWYQVHLSRGGETNLVLERMHALADFPQVSQSQFVFQAGHA